MIVFASVLAPEEVTAENVEELIGAEVQLGDIVGGVTGYSPLPSGRFELQLLLEVAE